jgi:ribose transport system permease protein
MSTFDSLRAALPRTLNQERIVVAITCALVVVFSLILPNFLTASNLIALVQNVSILGILGVAMALTIIARGIDLSIVANMAVSVAWVLQLSNHGVALPLAIAMGFALTLAIGLFNGLLIAYLEIPAIFATLAMASAAYGFVRAYLLDDNLVYLKAAEGTWFKWIGSGQVLGVPSPVIGLAVVAFLAFLALRYTVPGRYLYAMGDNPLAARTAGVAMRPMIVLQYACAAGISFVAGVIMATAVDSMETRVARSNLVYDVILVVVIGGVGLSGGKGSIRNVIVGTLLIGVLLNGMTIMDVPYTLQNIIKSFILLIAIVVDATMNPRDEQTSQQGDI